MRDSTKMSGNPAGFRSILAGSLAVALWAGVAQAQPERREALWTEPAVATRIQEGIHANRTGWITVEVMDAGGQPAAGAEVEVELIRHEFLFGANGFMIEGFESARENQQFEERFTALFNFVTAPFYWQTLEPRPGTVRFTRGSDPIYRRPPPDVVLDFARRHGLAIKGHPLVWDNPIHHVPGWLPDEARPRELALWHNLERNVTRYRDSIPCWDVVNEACSRHVDVPMPRDFVFRAFEFAARLLPPSSTMILNETTRVWREDRDEYSQFYLLIESLLARGARIDAIGLQFHFFNPEDLPSARDGKSFTPAQIFRILDLYGRFHRPLHITEITIPTLPNTPEGELLQAELARHYYRAWFSHPAVEAITWWNLVDQTAVPGEDKWNGGLLRRDFSVKPSYEALRRLIREEWTTREKLRADAQGRVRFRGYYGEYRVTAESGTRTVTSRFLHGKAQPGNARVVLGGAR